ncbi:hypothetical protein [Stratiformator vulcanicus]|uniref:Uncharacterized protein n=1 Tax=Stratiformator vulcanicus TaxID=2527980 RepID=A0A517R741_9PLAN|nr:hypothetical protein [Stratiformator vulcanicus]QDT39695.1 hypothetical protein Pan189_41040 [Stratiformator vulcanicus]
MQSETKLSAFHFQFPKEAYQALCTSLVAFAIILTPIVGVGDETEFDQYGGNKSMISEATGFFRLEKFEDRHFLVTPEGHGYRALGINHFHNMSSKDYDAAIQQIKSWGFNAGCYQGPRWMWERYPYTKGINLVPVCVWKPASQFAFKDVFDPTFLTEMETAVRKVVEPQSDNKMLIGYFWTDIPIWSRMKNGGWIKFYKSLPADSAGGMKWRSWKAAHEGNDESEFLAVIAKQLYSKGYEIVRRYDKNHLILGDRYHQVDIPEAVVREALPYIDAISIQPTSREFNFKVFDQIYQQYKKPIYIADHVSSYATDAFPVTMGQAAGSADAYGAYYRRYVTAALSRPYMIGFNKCQYQDEPRPRLLKQGLLNVNEQPYPVVDRVREANYLALNHAYEGTEPRFAARIKNEERPDVADPTTPLRILAPASGAKLSTQADVVIRAAVDLEKLGGRQVRFYYVDKQWKLIGRDETAPFEVTWKSPPAGDWDIVVAVHGNDWKILSKSRVSVSVAEGSIATDASDAPPSSSVDTD